MREIEGLSIHDSGRKLRLVTSAIWFLLRVWLTSSSAKRSRHCCASGSKGSFKTRTLPGCCIARSKRARRSSQRVNEAHEVDAAASIPYDRKKGSVVCSGNPNSRNELSTES